MKVLIKIFPSIFNKNEMQLAFYDITDLNMFKARVYPKRCKMVHKVNI